MPTAEVLLEVVDLRVEFSTLDGVVHAVGGLSFSLRRGETLGIVGESGSGKSVTNLALLGLLDRQSVTTSGRAVFKGRDLLGLTDDELRRIRGKEIAMIFQDPFSSLHPMYRVGDQLVEAIRAHGDVSRTQAEHRVIELLGEVGIPRPRERFRDYPHQYSGGMRQRAMIAMALTLNPDILIADEPTTALDVTVQAQILELIDRVKHEFDIGVILVSHDLAVVAEVAQSVMVMYAGRAVEIGPTADVFDEPLHPYTWGLIESIPRVERPGARLLPIEGAPPSLITLPSGCFFHPRCPYRFDRCSEEGPELRDRGSGHSDACHLPPGEKHRLWTERETNLTAAP